MFLCTFCAVACHGRDSRPPQTSKSTKRLERRSRPLPSKIFARAFPVSLSSPSRCSALLTCPLDEFNQYLTYVRNLGFEDTPDYDYLRDLFTQALKNTGEIEDGEYDWMKLNNGKGWEAISKHPSSHQYHQAHNQGHATTTGELRPVAPTQVRQPTQLTPNRLNAPHPPPPSPGKPMPTRSDRQNAPGTTQTKRQNGPAGVIQKPAVATPTASTQAQFQTSTPNLQPAVTNRGPPPATPVSNPQPQPRGSQAEPKKTFMQKLASAFCCGMYHPKSS
jgi:casein kinase 1